MTTLILDRAGLALKPDGKALALYENGSRVRALPLRLIDRIVIVGDVDLSTRVLTMVAEAGTAVVLLSRRHARRVATLVGPRHNDARIRFGQWAAAQDPAVALAVARAFVRTKLKAQRRLLRQLLAARPDARKPLFDGLQSVAGALDQLPKATSLESMRGVEGAAARAHFAALAAVFPPALGFAGRNRRPPRDPVNAVLSLAYTMLHHEAVAAAHAAGLDPQVGYLHGISFGRESLAADLIEPLRAQADGLVWGLFRDRSLREEHFARDGDACLLGKAGREHFFPAWEAFVRPPRRQLRRMARTLASRLTIPDSLEDTWTDESF
ncbi:MAG: CRISPR-associated endonuclease Cas1 [Rhodocyclaceae bacterium]|nr:CRISPR-associated endonuclease Cas1 [Rhodocyclaceae bacterium]